MPAAGPDVTLAMPRSRRARARTAGSRTRTIGEAGLRSVTEIRLSADAALEAVRRDVLFTTFACLLAVFTALLPVAIARDLRANPLMILPHLVIYAAVLATYLRRRQLPSRVAAGVMIVSLYLVGTIGLLSVGIVGLNFLAYAVIVIAVPMAFGPGAGVAAAVICVATYAVVALLVSRDVVTFSVLSNDYLASAANWTHTGIVFAGFAVIVVTISGCLYRKLHELVRSEVARSRLLKNTNAELADANERLRTLNEQLESRIAERTQGLANANRELESFSYTVSHDLRSPLQVIDGFSSLALQEGEMSLNGKAREYVQRIQRGACRMQAMIGGLLEFSRLACVRTQAQDVNLSEMAEGIVADMRATDASRKLSIVIEPDMRVAADPCLIRNVLHNLLANAWKFTAKTQDAHIEFATRELDGERVLCLRDNGVGFDAAKAERLFHPFVRLHDSREFAGNGVGLATTRRIIERHGGRIWAESRKGEGAAFLFTLRP